MIQETVYEGTIATLVVDQENERFSAETLEQIAEQAAGLPVLWNFEATSLPVGIVDAVSSHHSQVYAVVRCGQPLPIVPHHLYVVPGFVSQECEIVDGVRVFRSITLASFGITNNPVDVTLEPLREVTGPER
jgi:hypothetical protein